MYPAKQESLCQGFYCYSCITQRFILWFSWIFENQQIFDTMFVLSNILILAEVLPAAAAVIWVCISACRRSINLDQLMLRFFLLWQLQASPVPAWLRIFAQHLGRYLVSQETWWRLGESWCGFGTWKKSPSVCCWDDHYTYSSLGQIKHSPGKI